MKNATLRGKPRRGSLLYNVNRREFCRNMAALTALGFAPTAFCGEGEDWKAAFRKVGFDPDAKGSSFFLVTSDIHSPTCHIHGIIHEEQEKWICDTCAAYPKDKPLVVLVHQPSVGATGMERDIGRVSKKALAGRTGVTWLLAGHNHCNANALWDLPGGGKLMVATHTRDIDGWWAYGVRDGQIVARLFKAEKSAAFERGKMPPELKSRGEIPLAYQGRADVAWRCFVGDADERAARLSIGKTGDNDGALFYLDKLRYRFPKAKIAPKATRFAVLGSLCGHRKTREPARLYFSADGAGWTEAFRSVTKGGLVEFPIPAALVGAEELHLRYGAFHFGCDESVAGFAFLN